VCINEDTQNMVYVIVGNELNFLRLDVHTLCFFLTQLLFLLRHMLREQSVHV
jgi:hypothetical protein